MEIRTDQPGYGAGLTTCLAGLKPKLICFDYFDTLVTRSIHPEDVKRLACERVGRMVDESLTGPELYRLRSEVEGAQCRANEERGGDLECSLVDVLGEMWDRTPSAQRMTRREFIDLASDVELAIEQRVQVPDPEIIETVSELRRLGFVCWVVSDFYFNKPLFQRLLTHHGIANLFANVEVSCERMSTKRSGKLFRQIISDSGIEPSQIVMVGDNGYSDVTSARESGLQAIHLDRTAQHSHYGEITRHSNDITHIEGVLRRILRGRTTVFKELALTLHYFVDQLHAALVGAGARDVFFLSREGQFLKVLFDHFQAQHGFSGGAYVRSHYFEVSRRSTLLPSLKPLDQEDFHTLFRQYRRISVEEFLSSLGLEALIHTLRGRLPFDLGKRLEDLPTSTEFQALLADETFRTTYERERSSRRDALGTYLDGFSRVGRGSTLHVVDVGWKGTIQDNLFSFIADRGAMTQYDRVAGHYLGLVARGSAAENNVKNGIVFSNVNGPSRNFAIFNENRALFEVVLAADHGSVHSYERSPAGMVRVKHQEFSEEPLYVSKILPLQEQLLEIFVEIDEVLRHSNYPKVRLQGFVARQHARMLLQPNPDEIAWFQDVYHLENFGVFEHTRFDAPGRASAGFLEGLRFYLSLRKNGAEKLDMGFWPWLTCLQRGGRWVASRYAASLIRRIED